VISRLLVWLFLSCGCAVAQDFALNWFTFDGGGGQSTGGVYSVSGTIGQPDAGTMSGGNFTLTGGFWSVIAAVPTPGAPLLTITRTATNSVIVSWPDPSTGFELQENPDLDPAHWVKVAALPTVVGGQKQVIVPAPAGSRFYRLRKSGP
jgi:hypothetical protein